ncbi:MAG TPA: M20 family metallopeptidase [Gaiellaceae bacterium]|nr:M20 family metallopeptidase [Gaiellaceae bacterium]
MPRARAAELLAWLEEHELDFVRLVERLARTESPSLDASAQAAVFAALATELESVGYRVRRVDRPRAGPHLYARPASRCRHAPFQLVVGHMDTVWPVGTLRQMPVYREGDILFGPGTCDMKAGLAQLVFAVKALDACRLVPTVTPIVVINADEEIGSPTSERMIERFARLAERAFVLEAGDGPDGRLKIARKGVGRYELKVRGRASHAGTSFDEGVSAVLELSHQVQRLFALNDPRHGVTVNVGTVDGGMRPNVVAPEASAEIGVRVPTARAARDLDRSLRSLRPVLRGSMLELSGGIGRPPMEATPRNRALFAVAQRLGRDVGLSLVDAGLVGGGSDANTTSRYTATLDGLGPIGDGDHATHEHIRVRATTQRTALLALLLLEPALRPGRQAPPRAASATPS